MTAEQRAALVVEDDEQIAYILRFILEREGFKVHYAATGRDARALIESIEAPAIVTLDVMLPHADGFELLALLRGRPGWGEVPVIMLTARSQEKDIARGLEAGASDYMLKPFKPDELRARVRKLVKP
jgi:DNA-binding response OmpR family regulator